jgi:hypothetical protein
MSPIASGTDSSISTPSVEKSSPSRRPAPPGRLGACAS